jgi:hypothetical protein
MLTQERAKEIFSYYPDSGLLFRKLKNGKERLQSCKDSKGYVITYADKKTFKAHRVIWLIENGSFPESFIDHANGIRDDNRIVNLRCANPTQSCANRAMPKKKLNLPKGTVIRNRPRKYVVLISSEGKEQYIGAYFTKEESAKAYNDAAVRIFGEFASLNELGIWGEGNE